MRLFVATRDSTRKCRRSTQTLLGELHRMFHIHETTQVHCLCFVRRYTEVANNVQSQETILSIQFILLDSSPLKNAILGHCLEWQNKFTSLLYEIATARLTELTEFLKTNCVKSVALHCCFVVVFRCSVILTSRDIFAE